MVCWLWDCVVGFCVVVFVYLCVFDYVGDVVVVWCVGELLFVVGVFVGGVWVFYCYVVGFLCVV